MRLQAICYRGHDPKWSFSPLSGDGAATAGGRFNPKGVPALYLALSIDTVILETTQGFPYRLEPLMIVTYEVDVADIVDLRTPESRQVADVKLEDMGCGWRFDLASGEEPASWRIANRFRPTVAGILVPSFANGARADMHNLVLWKWGPNLPHQVNVYDPHQRLPKDQRSWAP